MRTILFLGFLLYDVIAFGSRLNNYDYEDGENKRHTIGEERRNWRKKSQLKPIDSDHKDWDDRRRMESDSMRYSDDDKGYGSMDRQRDMDPPSSMFRGQRRYDELDKMISGVTNDLARPSSFLEKEPEKKPISMSMNCDRAHERYEPCFAGCASVTCDNPHDRLRPCYPFCEPGCVCVHPYVRDDRTHKCVLPEDCTKGLKGIPDLGDDN
ncbi:hypothetical protein RR48_10689 [Papilio machaon]|uniref:TIL domain-containing protein n=1 Tax=Papilio machaon TaxID=76193 RepID=A0A194RN37_PAPMA|nr:hypothetical protein RR48_10689 [Papilio machaon]